MLVVGVEDENGRLLHLVSECQLTFVCVCASVQVCGCVGVMARWRLPSR